MDHAEKLEKYGPGEWMDEPDHLEFRHAGFVCLVHRGPSGALCGYVGVPPEHPWHGKDYSAVHELSDVNVHGGLTYANECSPPLCHVPEPGEPEHLWWLGFDCAHSGDVSPSLAKWSRERGFGGSSSFGERYRCLAYVQHETKSLADQAKAAADGSG